MKRILSFLLSVALLLSFVACGNDNANGDNTGTENNSSTQSEDKTSSEPTSSSTPSTSSSTPSTPSSTPSTPSSTPSTPSSTPSTPSSTPSTPSSTPSTPVELEKPKYPASTEDVYNNEIVRYELNDECKGYYFAPKAPGKYQTVIMMHGQSGVYTFKQKLVSSFNHWVKQGYIEPVVVVIPEILTSYGVSDPNTMNIDDFQYFIYESKPKRFAALLTSVEKGTLTSQIDTSKSPYVAGFSMGGMAALHAGADYNDRIKYVAGLSPAKSFYLGDGQWGFYNLAKDIHFSDAADAHIYLSAGEGEQNGDFLRTINTYEQGIKVNNGDKLTKFVAPSSWGPHDWAIAQKEIFMYLYFASFGKIPSNKLVEKVCDVNVFVTPPKTIYE